MERSRSKRNYYYDQDYNGDSMGRTKPRYNNSNNYQFGGGGGGGGNNRFRGGGGGGNGRLSKPHQDSMVTTTYRILCHDAKAGGVIGKAGTIIKSIRQHTGAWINVHELVAGDVERIIEISDTRRRDAEGRIPAFSPAQEALFLVHDRILESEPHFGCGGIPEEDEDYGGVRAGVGRVVTRLVVSRMHVGCLLGKGGKIIEHMRIETKTHIRILPRDSNLPRCVSLAEEIVQIVGEPHTVKNALGIVSSRLRESQHRDRGNFQGRIHSPERPFLPADEYIPQRRQTSDRFPHANYRSNNYNSRQSNYAAETAAVPVGENAQHFYNEELVFRILCPVDKVVRVVGESQGIIDLLQNEIGVDVTISDPVAGSDEQIITISSEEHPDDQFFPAQEALLHIQTRIVDLIPDKDNLVTTRLLVPSRDSVCLDGKAGSVSEITQVTGASVQILAREELPRCVSINDVVVQIDGEIKAARNALVELTLRLRSHMYNDPSHKETPPASTSTTGPLEGVAGVVEVASSNTTTQSHEGLTGSNLNIQQVSTITPQNKEVVKAAESEHRDEVAVTTSRIPVPLVTRSTLEVVLPEQAVPKLVTKSRNKLVQISEWSGASVTLVEDRPEETQNIIRISGTPEQAERAQSLLQGFILSIQEDGL